MRVIQRIRAFRGKAAPFAGQFADSRYTGATVIRTRQFPARYRESACQTEPRDGSPQPFRLKNRGRGGLTGDLIVFKQRTLRGSFPLESER